MEIICTPTATGPSHLARAACRLIPFLLSDLVLHRVDERFSSNISYGHANIRVLFVDMELKILPYAIVCIARDRTYVLGSTLLDHVMNLLME